MVKNELEKTLSEDWIKHSIQKAVNQTVQNAIDGLSNNYRLKEAVTDALSKAVSDMVNKESP